MREVFFTGFLALFLFAPKQEIYRAVTSGSGGGAPTNATYITQTADATLTNEQALSGLATGYMKVTNGTGVISSQAVPIPIADGGTNGINKTAAFDNLSPNTTKGDIICHDGVNNVRLAAGADASVLGYVATAPCGLATFVVPLGDNATADTTTVANATTTTFPTGLGAVVSVGQSIHYTCDILWSGNTATNGIGLSFVSTATFTRFGGGAQIPITNTDGNTSPIQWWLGNITASADFVIGTATPVINTPFVARMWLIATNATVAGAVVPAFRNEVAVAGNTITVYSKSNCMALIY